MRITDAKSAVDEEWKKLETIPTWKQEKVRSKKEVILEAHRDKKKAHFASLMDICHPKNAELEPKLQEYKKVELFSVVTLSKTTLEPTQFSLKKGSSASQMTAVKIMDVIAKLPDCAGQAADAVSAYAQVKMEEASRLLKIRKSECPDVWIRLPRTQMAEIMGKH